MTIALPVSDGKLSSHFGHCDQFMFFETAGDEARVLSSRTAAAPPHQPGALPRWLVDQGASVLIAGQLGRRAQALFADLGVTVVAGAPVDDPATIVENYLAGDLEAGDGDCGH